LKTDPKTNKTEFTFIELMIAILIIAILVSIAIPLSAKFKKEAQIELAIAEMGIIEKKIGNFVKKNGKLPEDLSSIELENKTDPWGRPYRYIKIYGSDDVQNGSAKPKKNQSQQALNTDFDLYSVGQDGNSAALLTEQISLDDIIRANNGAFMGLAADY
jgi:general secretion pathway protein G